METTASGYLGGLPLRLLVGYRRELIATRLGLRPVPEHRVMLVGARDLDPPDVAYLTHAPIGRAEAAGLDAAALPGGPLYVHVDPDVIDPAAVPGLRYPAPGRPRAADVVGALHMILATAGPPRWVSPAPGTLATAPPHESASSSRAHWPRGTENRPHRIVRGTDHFVGPVPARRLGGRRPARNGGMRFHLPPKPDHSVN